jgi:hypothetical protein
VLNKTDPENSTLWSWFSVVCAEFSDVHSGDSVTVENSAKQRFSSTVWTASFLLETRPDFW